MLLAGVVASHAQSNKGSHFFDCFSVITDSPPPEFNDFSVTPYGKATKDMAFSNAFSVIGQDVVLYTTKYGAKIYDAKPIIRFEDHVGRRLKHIQKSLMRGDLEAGFPAFANSQVFYEWNGEAIEERRIEGQIEFYFNLEHFKFYLSHEVKLPRWYYTQKRVPSSSSFKKWKSYSCDIAQHERDHINPTRQYIALFASEIHDLKAGSVADLRYKMNLLWQKTQKRISDENVRIDQVTQHGRRSLKK